MVTLAKRVQVQRTYLVAHSHLCYISLVILGVLYASNHPCQSNYVLEERSALTVYNFCGTSAIILCSKSRNYIVRYEKRSSAKGKRIIIRALTNVQW